MKNPFASLGTLAPEVKKNAVVLFLAYFFILFTYPFTRSATQSIFLESYTASDMPFTWFLSIVTLSATIYLSNIIQVKIGVHKLFSLVSLVSIFVFGGGLLLSHFGIREAALGMFIWKEVYIVVLVHLFLGFCNNYFSYDQVKLLYGPLGAIGSIGTILGGQLTSLLAKTSGTNSILYISYLALFLSFFVFYRTKNVTYQNTDKKEEIKERPLTAIKDVKGYVFLIAAIIALTQFVINIADLQFNIIFEKVVETKDERSFYLGQLYSMINGVALGVQFFVMPWLLKTISTRTAHLFIPLFYMILVAFGFGLGGAMLWPIAFVFVSMKGVDYSLFAVVKELLYAPLSAVQKYGAKYIADMWTYRTAKALIAILLMYVNNIVVLSALQFLFLFMWLICVILIFRRFKRLG